MKAEFSFSISFITVKYFLGSSFNTHPVKVTSWTQWNVALWVCLEGDQASNWWLLILNYSGVVNCEWSFTNSISQSDKEQFSKISGPNSHSFGHIQGGSLNMMMTSMSLYYCISKSLTAYRRQSSYYTVLVFFLQWKGWYFIYYFICIKERFASPWVLLKICKYWKAYCL